MWDKPIYFKIIVILTLLMASFNISSKNIGLLEGKYFPVVSDITLSNPRPLPPPTYRHTWEGRAEKLRSCDHIETVWYLGPRDGRKVQVKMDHGDKPQVRNIGILTWKDIKISLDVYSVLNNSHADVVHRCHPFWDTVTPFYDSQTSLPDEAP